MVSETKKFDKEFMLEIGMLITELVRRSTKESLDLAEKFGEHYLALEERIKTHDYSLEDKFYEPLCRN